MESQSAHRFAVYAAPQPDTPLGRFGNAWLGRDPGTGETLPRPMIAGYQPSEIAAITGAPARYGFHGTLVAPFRLADGYAEDDLVATLVGLTADLAPVTVPGFAVRSLGRFAAIMPEYPSDGLADLSRQLVESLDRFHAPMTDAEWARRTAGGLTPNQERLLGRWGYPYVMEEFRFHLTLTDKIDTQTREQLRDDIASYASDVLGPHTFDSVALFAEPEPGADFVLRRRFSFAAAQPITDIAAGS